MTERHCHLTFTLAAAHTLRAALDRARSAEPILALQDDLSCGPLNVGVDARVRWLKEYLGAGEWQAGVVHGERFISAGADEPLPKLAWVSFREAQTFAGFLWWLAHAQPSPVLLADANALRDGDDQAVHHALTQAKLLPQGQREKWQHEWMRLEEENAAIRVVDEDALVSASIDHFDADLLALASPDWQRMAVIVGKMFHVFACTEVWQAGDAFLATRLRALVQTGELEASGEIATMAACRLRLPRV